MPGGKSASSNPHVEDPSNSIPTPTRPNTIWNLESGPHSVPLTVAVAIQQAQHDCDFQEDEPG